ncbi:helix-turn-helix domain-containing protein [Nocardiopsis synnemataformans]|uniref:helix-turn-helix domain-containing protein n=1 Tax=Nocardiopsis synnemataformans TaxID=61305 RepID=UPI003EBD2832
MHKPPRLPADQREVLTLLAQGRTYEEIAEQLKIAERTVGRRLARATQALHATNAVHAVCLAVHFRLVGGDFLRIRTNP